MGWADLHIQNLLDGKTVEFRPLGNSMSGKIEDKQLCVVAPLSDPPNIGDIVLCRINGSQYLHLIVAIKIEKDNKKRYQIGNNKGRINGWIGLDKIYGKVIQIGEKKKC